MFGGNHKFKGLAVFFEDNNRVVIGWNDNRQTIDKSAYCHHKMANADGPVRAKVISSQGHLSVQFYDPTNGHYTECVKVRVSEHVKVHRGFLSFSASTSKQAHSEHDLLSVTTATFSPSTLSGSNASFTMYTNSMRSSGKVYLYAGLFILISYGLYLLYKKWWRGPSKDSFSSRLDKMYGSIL